MTTDQMIAEVKRVQWYAIRPYFDSIDIWGRRHNKNGCYIMINQSISRLILESRSQMVNLKHPPHPDIPAVFRRAVEDCSSVRWSWIESPFSPDRWPNSIWVLLDAILEESRHPLLTAVCESILKTRMVEARE